MPNHCFSGVALPEEKVREIDAKKITELQKERGGGIAMALEGGFIAYGDEDAWWNMTEEIKNDTVIGKVLAQGTGIAGKVIGSRRITACKGQGFPAYDPRVYKDTGVTFATSPQGACHTAVCTLPGRKGYHPPVDSPMDPSARDNMVLYSRDLQSIVMMVDSFGLCSFMGSSSITKGFAVEAFNAMMGTSYSFKDFMIQGEKLTPKSFCCTASVRHWESPISMAPQADGPVR